MKIKLLLIFLTLAFLVAGCGSGGEGAVSIPLESPATETMLPSDTPVPSLTFTPSPTLTPSATPIVILDPEPIEIGFTTSDGQILSGRYYPASENPAPVIILVHWATGDQSEWTRIAQWLQDRGELVKEPDYNRSWLSSNWFPEKPTDMPLGVITFTLRSCEGECTAYLPTDWLRDMEAVMAAVAQMQGVDRTQVMTAGASIGADIAIYGCNWLNQTGEGSCRGSFSLSPASLTTIPYQAMVDQLVNTDPPGKVYCLFGLRDDASLETCGDLSGITAIDYGYIENHGLELVQPGQGRDPLLSLADFIQEVVTGEDNED